MMRSLIMAATFATLLTLASGCTRGDTACDRPGCRRTELAPAMPRRAVLVTTPAADSPLPTAASGNETSAGELVTTELPTIAAAAQDLDAARVFVLADDALHLPKPVSYDASIGVADVRKIFTADGPARGLIVSRDLLEAVVRPTERYDAPDGSLEYYALLTVLWYGHVLAAIDSWDNMIAERLGLEESAPFDPFGRPLQGGASHPSAATIVYFSPTTGWHHTSLASASMSLPAPYFAVDVELRQAVETAESHRADDRRLRETLASPAASAMP